MIEVIFLTLICLLPLINHPLVLGFLILRTSSVLRVILCKFLVSWFGYRIFLVYVGGILVIFSYVVALTPNITGFNTLFFRVFRGILVCLRIVIIRISRFDGILEFNRMSYLTVRNGRSIFGLFNSKNVLIMLFLLLMLLVTIVIVVKICYYRSGPLRPFR